ncbi:MAG: hypothetical protein OEY56_11390 [Cyclobacteriaceae bacterium]|nr:hypothetical protein [Cyclobacteriaceae bacterium]
MDLKAFSVRFAAEKNASYREYDDLISVFVLRLPDARYQTVWARIFIHPDYNSQIVHISSKICTTDQPIDYALLLASISNYIHTRFVIEENFLKAEASFFLENVNEAIITEMIMEVATTADLWEKNITGQDIQ